MKKYIIIITLLISTFLLTLNLIIDKEELKENNVVDKSITMPSTIQAYTYMGEKTDKTYEWLLRNKTVNKITCKNGTIATFNYEDNSVSLSNIKLPDYCTIDFKEGYLVSLTAGSTGTVSPASQTTGYNGTISFTVTPGDEYKAEFSTNTCGGTLSGNTYTVSKVTSNKSCSITFKKKTPTLVETIKSYAISNTNGVYNENGYRYEGSDPSNYIYMTNKSTNEKELWRIIGVFNDGENGEEVIRVRRHYEKNSYPTMAYDSNKTNHFPNTTMYNTLSSTYNLTNYSHTVNFKMHLGTSDSYETLTSSGWYTTERGTTPGKTAADSYNSSVSFIGSVGLIYPSDYGYAVLASDCVRTTIAYKYNETAACYNNNWLFQGNSQEQWLISPSASSADYTSGIYSNGYVVIYLIGDFLFANENASSPVMALSSDVLVNGSGTKTDPYEIIN